MILESLDHPFSCFVTLTYNDESLPEDWCVHKRAVQLYLKRLRQELHPRTFRYYAVGEYGDQNWRPHYHLIIFGVSPTEEATLLKCWSLGFIKVGTCEPHSISYVCGYITKKMTNPKDSRLEGRLPEFALMSRKPGIGFGAVNVMYQAYQTIQGQAVLKEHGWIISKMKASASTYPLGTYLQKKLVNKLALTDQQKGEFRYNYIRSLDAQRPQTRAQRVAIKLSQRAAQQGRYIKRGRLL